MNLSASGTPVAFALFACLGSASCSARRATVTFPVEMESGSELLFIFGKSDFEVHLVSLSSPAFELDSELFDDAVTLEAWILEASPEALGLTPGRLQVQPVGADGAPLPWPVSSWASEVDAPDATDWRPILPSERARRIRLPGSAIDCLARGCFADGLCKIPCEPTSPLPAAPPMPPVLPGCALLFDPALDPDATCPSWFAACGPGAARLPGEPCRTIGAACGQTFPTFSPDANVAYVQSGASGGDGSLGAPFATISEALALQTATVAVAAGSYLEPLAISRSVAIVGACPEGVVLSQVAVSGARVYIEALTMNETLAGVGGQIVGRRLLLRGGVDAMQGAEVRLEDVLVAGLGLSIQSQAHVVLNRALIRGPVRVATTGTLEARSLVLIDAPEVATQDFNTVMRLEDVFWWRGGRALSVTRSASVSVTRAEMRAVGRGVFLSDDSQLTLVDLDLLDPAGLYGIEAQENGGGRIEVHRVRVVGANDSAFELKTVTLVGDDVIIERPRPSARPAPVNGAYGRGMNLTLGTSATLNRLVIEDSHRHAIRMSQLGTFARLSNVTIRNVLPGNLDVGGACPGAGGPDGLSVTCQSELVMEAFELDTASCGVSFDSLITLRDGAIRNMDFGLCGDPLDPASVQRVSIDAKIAMVSPRTTGG